jgi:acyl carrier protein
MTREEVESKLKDIIKPYLPEESDLEKVNANTNLLDDLNINSAHLVDIILDTEDAFNIRITDDAAEKMVTVNDVIDVVLTQIEA